MSGTEERGSVAVIAVCVMAAALWLGMSLFVIVDYGEKGSSAFIEETRLRLVAESRVERLARELEKNPSALEDLPGGTWSPYGREFCQQDVRVKVYLRHIADGAGEEDMFLKAWAEPETKTKYGQGKVVCGYLHRKGEECVWRGWRALDD